MSGLLDSVQSTFGKLRTTFINILDRMIPPEKRAETVSKLQEFAIENPKLAAFLATQIVLTGFPLVLFITFSITVFVFSLITALLIGLIAAVLFTLFMVGVALLVVLPTIFMATCTASFLFLWGISGFYLLKWFNEGDIPASEGTSIGDKINNLTGGRMGWLTNGVHKKEETAHTGGDKTYRTHVSENDGLNGMANGNSSARLQNLSDKPKDSANGQSEDLQDKEIENVDSAENIPSSGKNYSNQHEANTERC